MALSSDGPHTLLNNLIHIAQAALAGRILHLAGAETSLDFGFNLFGNRRFSELLDLSMYVRACVIEAITQWNGVLTFLDPDAGLHIGFLKYCLF